ncbi:helix-turn-helix domain-containing protein [Kitasatospora sp. NPDC058162]|uniref:helix-turn-helix domain-containing protein n=1 Tax=Kitasatospora sp. NPDC058162 TaxID=3346362 RepID=UPI0036DA608C
MAEVEREFIHEHTLIGLDTAAANGKHGGRPPALDDDQLAVALRRRDASKPITAIARHHGIGRSTLYRALAAPPTTSPAGASNSSQPSPPPGARTRAARATSA